MKTTLMTCMMIITMSPVPKRRGKVLLMFVKYATFALHYLVSEPYITNPSFQALWIWLTSPWFEISLWLVWWWDIITEVSSVVTNRIVFSIYFSNSPLYFVLSCLLFISEIRGMCIGPDMSTSMTSLRKDIILGMRFENDEKFLLFIRHCSYC